MRNIPPFPCKQIGNQSKPGLVFLHGFLGSGADWLPVAESFSGDFSCILPDLPGHGQNTEIRADEVLDYDLFSDGLARTLPPQAVDLVGYSLGGRVALYFALKYPERVKRLVLESTSPGIKDPEQRAERALLDQRRAEKILSGGLGLFVDDWYSQPLFSSLRLQPELSARLKSSRMQNSAAWMARVISEMSPGRQPWLGDRLGDLKMEVLLLAGELDLKYAAGLTSSAAKIPQAKAVSVPNAGHSIHAEQPESFIGILESFFNDKP